MTVPCICPAGSHSPKWVVPTYPAFVWSEFLDFLETPEVTGDDEEEDS